MSVRDRLADPWGAFVAAMAGGLTWAVIPGSALGIGLGVGVAAVVFGAKVVGESLLSGGRADTGHDELPGPTELPEPPPGTAARTWLDRAERALRSLDETVESAAAGVAREQLRTVGEKASNTRDAIRRLAGRATAFEQAMTRIRVEPLTAEQRQLRAEIGRTRNTAVLAEHRAALASVEEQLQVHTRLAEARETVLARMRSTALGIESLGARAVELLALAAATGDAADHTVVDELSGELEALRGGLLEVERITRRGAGPDG